VFVNLRADFHVLDNSHDLGDFLLGKYFLSFLIVSLILTISRLMYIYLVLSGFLRPFDKPMLTQCNFRECEPRNCDLCIHLREDEIGDA
jgi:hypothetical protein